MARLGCRCGATMGTTDCPSPYGLEIFYDSEIRNALINDPGITVHNFLLGWDEKHECQREYMDRNEPVDYWYCLECHRVYEVQAIRSGRWLRVYNRSGADVPVSFDGWKQIWVMPETATYAATEVAPEISLSDYLRQHDSVLYYLSPDETVAHVVDKASSQILLSYVLEDFWSPSAEG